MPSFPPNLRRASSHGLALAAVAFVVPSRADAAFNWKGGNHDNWSDDNWEGLAPASLGVGVGFNFGADGNRPLPLDFNGRINPDLVAADPAFGRLNFAGQAWTMSGRYLVAGDSTITVAASSPGVTIENDMTITAYELFSTYSNFDLHVATELRMTGVISQYENVILSDTTGILRKYGAGTLTLTNRNSYTGGTNVFGGRLIEYYPHGNYNAGAALEFRTNENQTHSGSIIGAGSFTKSGAAALTFTGPISYTGTTTVDEGRLILLGQLPSTPSYTINSGAELEFNLANIETLNKPIYGAGTLVKSGGGTFTINELATHTGGTVVNAGKVIDLNPHGSYVTNSFLELRNENVQYISGQGGISGSGSLIKSGAGNLFVSDNTYTGGTTINAGRLTDFNPHGNYVNGSELEFRTITDASYSGEVVGTGSLTKSGFAPLILTAAHSHTGGTTVAEGRLIDQNANGDYVTNADLEFANASNRDFTTPVPVGPATPNTIGGTGNFTKSGAGALTMYRSNTYAGSTTITAGSIFAFVDNALPTGTDLTVGSGGQYLTFRQTVASLSGAGSVSLLTSNPFTVNGAASTEFSGVVSGGGSLVKSGTGTLTLSGVNTYSGGTTVSGGRLIDANPHGNYLDNAALEFRTTGSGTYGGVVSGTGSLVKSGNGTLTLSGKNTYSGGTTVSGGLLVETIPHGDYANSADLEFRTATDQTYSGGVSGTGLLVKNGAGTLTLTGSNVHSGGTAVKGGTLRLRQNAALGSGSGLDVTTGATFDLNGFSQSLGSLKGQGNVTLGAGGQLLVQGDGSTFAGVISGAGSFTKVGPGTMTLSGPNTYSSGSHVLDAGTLRVTGSIGGALTVAPGATFDNAAPGGLVLGAAELQGTVSTSNLTRFTGPVSGAGNFSGPGAVRFDGGYAPGNLSGSSLASVEFRANLLLGSSNILTMELGGTILGTGYDHLTVRDAATFDGILNVATIGGFTASRDQSFDLFDFRSSTGTFTSVSLPALSNGLRWDTSSLYTTGVIRTVPEPATLAALGLGALALLRRRRQTR